MGFPGQRVAGALYDWELEPLVGFVRSGSDARFTYMGVHGEYHKAFAGNLAGFNLFLLDTFRSVRTPEQAHRVVKTPVPGYTVGEGTDRIDKEATRKLKRWMRRNHLMFTDLDVEFVFRPESGDLVVDGDPYWISVDSKGPGSGRITGRFEDRATTLAANPAVFGSGFRLAKFAAVFKYLKAECPERWRALRQSVAKQKRALDLYTIPLRQMPYACAEQRARPASVMPVTLGATCFAGLGPLVQRALERQGAVSVSRLRVRNFDYLSFRLERSKIRAVRSVHLLEDVFLEISRTPEITKSSDVAKLSRRLGRVALLESVALKNELFADRKRNRRGRPTYCCFVRQNRDHRVHRKRVSQEVVSSIARLFPRWRLDDPA